MHRTTGEHVDCTLAIEDAEMRSVVGRLPAAPAFEAHDVADVHLALNGQHFMATGQSITFVNRPKMKVGMMYVSAPDDFGWTFQHNVARLELERLFFGQIEMVTANHVEE